MTVFKERNVERKIREATYELKALNNRVATQTALAEMSSLQINAKAARSVKSMQMLVSDLYDGAEEDFGLEVKQDKMDSSSSSSDSD